MSERLQQPPAPGVERAQADERVPARMVLNLDRFKLLANAVRTQAAEDRALVAEELINLLIGMRDPGHDAAEAAAILRELDLKTLSAVVDGQGRNARKEAVETLMVMGFPHALKITPEDFAWARDVATGLSPKARGVRHAIVLGLAFASAIGLLLGGLSGDFPVAVSGVLVGLGALTWTAAVVIQNRADR